MPQRRVDNPFYQVEKDVHKKDTVSLDNQYFSSDLSVYQACVLCDARHKSFRMETVPKGNDFGKCLTVDWLCSGMMPDRGYAETYP